MRVDRRWLGVALAALAGGVIVGGLILQWTAPPDTTADLTVGDRVAPATMAMFALVGGVLTWRRPDHVFGWILVGFATLMGLGGAATGIVERHDGPASTPVDVAEWLQSWTWVAAISLLGIGLLLFPDGQLPSRRWRHLLRLDLLALAGALALAVALWPERGPELVELGDQWPGVAGVIGGALLPVVFLGFLASLVSLVVRYRTASVIVRLQLKWLLLAVGMLVTALLLAALSDLLGFGDQWWQDLFGVSGLFFLPIAVGLAVLRYRLFDIDRIVGRTVSYALLTAALVAVYGLGVLGVGSVVSGGSSDLVVAGSTLAVAALFRPLRSRIQGVVDRRFNRARYDAARTVEAFGARLRDEVDVGALGAELCRTASSTVQPRQVSVWLPSA